jgi:hypothetical protein
MRSTSNLRVFLLGGLGNQLYGALFARAISLRLTDEVELSDQLIPFGSHPNRSLVIDQLSWAIGPKVLLKCKKKFGQNLLLRSNLFRRLIWHTFRLFGRRQRLNLQDFWRQKWESSEKIEILDYFDDWFFAEYVRTYDSEFTKGLEFKEKYQPIANEKRVLVHVRIGDYLEHPEIYSLLSETYYLEAIDLIKEKHNLKETSVTVICENADEVRKYYPKLSSICTEIVDKKGLNSDVDAFNLLASSTHLIAGNSTFSLWAAWIGLTQRKTTIVPEDERLNGKQSGLREISWIVLDARTGKIKEKRPYVSWFKEREDRFHATMASLNESLSN